MPDTRTDDGAQGGAAGGTPPAPNGGQGTSTDRDEQGRPKLGNAAIDRLIGRYGSPHKVIRQLLIEAHDTRERNRNGATVPEGGIVLNKDEATRWREFSALGKPPAELRTVLTEHATLTREQAEQTAFRAFEQQARTAGYNPALVAKLAKADNVRVEVRQISVRDADGKTSQQSVLHIVDGDGDKAKAIPLEDYRKTHWKDLMPAPKPRADDELETETDDETDDDDGETPAPRPYPAQSVGTPRRTPSTEQTVNSLLAKRYALPKSGTNGATK